VYVDQSKSSLEKGGSATLDAFVALVPTDGTVQVHAALLPKTSKVATKGPAVRCIPTTNARVGGGNVSLSPMDIANVDSVDKVYRVLTKHMNVKVRKRLIPTTCRMGRILTLFPLTSVCRA
jgi:hypothetical protein